MNHIDNLSRQIHASHAIQSAKLFLDTPLGRKIGGVVVIIITLGVYLLTAYWYSKRFSARQLTPPEHLPPVHQPSDLPTTSLAILPPPVLPQIPSTRALATPPSDLNSSASPLSPPALPPRTQSTRTLVTSPSHPSPSISSPPPPRPSRTPSTITQVTPPFNSNESATSPVPALFPRTPSTITQVTPPPTPIESTTSPVPAPLPRPQPPPSDPNPWNNSSPTHTPDLNTSGPSLLQSVMVRIDSSRSLPNQHSPGSRPASGNYEGWDSEDSTPATEPTHPKPIQQPVAKLTITTTANSETKPKEPTEVEAQFTRRSRRSRPTSDDWNVDYRSAATDGLTIATSNQQAEANPTDAEVQQPWSEPKPRRRLSKKEIQALNDLRAYQEQSPQPLTSQELSSDESDDPEKGPLKTRSCPTSPPNEPSQHSGSTTPGINPALSAALSARRGAWGDTVVAKPSKSRTNVTSMFE